MRSYYEKYCPGPIKNVIDGIYGALPFSLKYGPTYRRVREFLHESERWERDRLEAFQVQTLRQLVQHAAKTVPFYRRLVESGEFDPKSIRTLTDIKALPMVSKSQMRANVSDFLCNTIPPRARHMASTGGSSGDPFKFYTTARQRKVEWAFVHHLWARVGFAPSDWRAVLRGKNVEEGPEGQHWQSISKTRELVLSSYHLDDINMHRYYNVIRDRGIQFLHCYPSAAFQFANFLLRNGLRIPLKAILAVSEAVHAFQRTAIEDAFQCRVYSFYGLSEQACLAGECEQSGLFHVQPQYGVTEIVDESGRDITMPGQIGEIVATGFYNYVMPFIRYRTGDHAVISPSRCSCGRNYLLLEKIIGRSYEYVITSELIPISLTALIFSHHFKAFGHIRKMQIVQERAGEIEMLIIPEAGYTKDDELEIRARLKTCVPEGLTIRFRYVEDIPATERGKHQFMIQRLTLDNVQSAAVVDMA